MVNVFYIGKLPDNKLQIKWCWCLNLQTFLAFVLLHRCRNQPVRTAAQKSLSLSKRCSSEEKTQCMKTVCMWAQKTLLGLRSRLAHQCSCASQECAGAWCARLPCVGQLSHWHHSVPLIGYPQRLIKNADAVSVLLSTWRRNLFSPPPSPPLGCK